MVAPAGSRRRYILDGDVIKFIENPQFIITSILTVIGMIISIIYKINNLKKLSSDNIKKKYEIYKTIITVDDKISVENKILKYTYLKEYIGFPITDAMANYILNSTKFYDIITVLRNVYSYIKHEPENNKIVLKNNHKTKMILFIISYVFFSLPALLFIICIDIVIRNGYLIPAILIIIPFTVVAIFFWNEAGNISLAGKLMKNIEADGQDCLQSETSCVPQDMDTQDMV
jgi:hypothetical protein